MAGLEPGAQATQVRSASATSVADIEAFCGGCHATPQPDHFPRAAWREEVEQGFRLFYQSNRTDLRPPVMADVIRYYEVHAPRDLELPAASSGVTSSPVPFRPVPVQGEHKFPAIAHLNWLQLQPGRPEELIVCDMGSGNVLALQVAPSNVVWRQLAKLDNPAHVERCDLDGDGRFELLVADLGSYTPSDHDRGRVVWLIPEDGGLSFRPVVLAEGMGRVADVQTADFDGDGDRDVLVAEFGWRQTGSLWLLENRGTEAGQPRFERRLIDSRHGIIHVPVDDWNGDGRPDFAGLVSQEHEVVELFLNRGEGQFEIERVFAADRPSFGSSGIHLADLDGDGDTDIVYTNGDMFDDYLLRDYHAVHWLENRGSAGWEAHELARLPGAHRALTGDLDGDGDLDIVACALIPEKVLAERPSLRLDSLIWLEQTSTGTFVRHVLEVDTCRHATLAVADFDHDGDLDLAVGNYVTGGQALPPLTLWWNERREPSEAVPRAVSGP